MNILFAVVAICIAIGTTAIQYSQIRRVSVPMVPWGQFILWLSGIGLAVTAFVHGVPWYLIVPLSLAVVVNIFFIVVVAFSKLPKTEPAVEVGDKFIDFTTLDTEGKSFTLSSLQGKPILLKFFRGHWCQYCANELAAYTRFYSAYQELGIEMVILSADTVEEAAKMKERLDLQAIVLSDEKLEIIDKYRVRHEKAITGARETIRPIAIPTALLITADGIIRWIDVSTNNRVRLDPLTVLIKSKTTLEKCELTNSAKLART